MLIRLRKHAVNKWFASRPYSLDELSWDTVDNFLLFLMAVRRSWRHYRKGGDDD